MKHTHLLTALMFLISSSAFSQNIGINDDGSTPDASAALHIKSTSKGLLIPIMTAGQKDSIIGPANGLLIYQTSNPQGFYYNKGTAGAPDWVLLLNSADALPAISGANLTNLNASNLSSGIVGAARLGTGTADSTTFLRGDGTWASINNGWRLTGNAGTDSSSFIGTTDDVPFRIRVNNENAGMIDRYHSNAFYGHQSANSNTGSGLWNSAFGNNSLYGNTSGQANCAFGYATLEHNTTGGFNTAIGYANLNSNTTGSKNSAFGWQADVTSGDLTNATAIGYNAKVNTSNSLVLGDTSLTNVGIGTGSPTKKLDVRGSVRIVDGTEGASKVLTSNATGVASWQTLTPSQLGSGTTDNTTYLRGDGTWATVSAGATQLSELSDVDSSGGVDKSAGNILVADGNKFVSVTMNGAASLNSTGALTISPGSISSTELANNSVGTGKIVDGAVTYSKMFLSANDIPYSKLNLSNSIVAADIATGAITTSKVANGTITTSKMADSAISGLKLLTGAVQTVHIASDAVTGAKIADGTIANVDIASNAAIAYSKLNLAGSIVSGDIAAGAITTTKVADSAISGLKLGTNAVATAHIADAAIIGSKLKVRTVNSNTILTDQDFIVIINGNHTVTLPANPVDGQMYMLCGKTTDGGGFDSNGKSAYFMSSTITSGTFGSLNSNIVILIYSSSLNGWLVSSGQGPA